MRSYRQAIAVALATFFASLLGMALRLVVPAQVLNDSKATVGGMAGLTTLGDAQKLVNWVWAFYWRGLFAGFQSPGLKVYSP